MNINEGTSEIERVVKDGADATHGIKQTIFTEKAFGELNKRIGEYIELLIDGSYKMSIYNKSDVISSLHVESTALSLVRNTGRKLYKHLGTIGGILLGTSLSQFVNIMSSTTINSQTVIISGAFGIIGSFLIALNIAKG